MDFRYKLTIAVITMNRATQLKQAIQSCVASKLPEKTQFVIVDNASTDDTPAVIRQLKESVPYDMVCDRQEENRGVGGGRNICFDLAQGEYVYFLDDDAIISENSWNTFFVKSLQFLDENPTAATLTTFIYDHVFGNRSPVTAKQETLGGLKTAFTFQGGSVFIRKEAFSSPLFLNIMYGNEEVSLSMDAMDRGMHNVYMPDISIHHMPMVDKWHTPDQDAMNMRGAANLYAIRKLQYPWVFLPLLYAAYRLRIHRYRLQDKSLIKTYRQKNREFCKKYSLRKVKIKTVIKSFKEFGATTF